MIVRKFFRAVSLPLAFCAVAACEVRGIPVTEGPEAVAKPVSAAELLSSYVAVNQGATSVPLLNTSGRGFIINNDGTMTYDDLKSSRELLLTSEVTFEEGNRICMDSVGTWTGACLDLYLMFDGTVRLRYEFGNGIANTLTTHNLNL